MTSSTLVTVATCALDQFAMDFDNNLQNILDSIRIARSKGARLRIGPELEVCGYSCEDHFLEADTLQHSWESIEFILKTDLTDGMLCDIGMPVLHHSVRYNCRILLLNRKVVLIRPKMWLAEDGNYREGRWFAPWSRGFELDNYVLPRNIRAATGGQISCPFGVGILQLGDAAYAVETCEELFTANNPGILLGLAGVDIFGNGSGSHHTLQKRTRRIELIEETTKKNGGIYLYANQMGCDGTRVLFDGCAMIAVNGKVIASGSQFSVRDVEVCCATVDLRDVWSLRAQVPSRARQAAISIKIPRVEVPEFYLCAGHDRASLQRIGGITPQSYDVQAHTAMEEIAFGPACWMWDYLRRSGMNGFFLPLSGGADSAATATMVAIMCQLLFEDISCGDTVSATTTSRSHTLKYLRRIVKDPEFLPAQWQDICKRIFFCAYMPTEFSSVETQERARNLAAEMGARFDVIPIDTICHAFQDTYSKSVGGRAPDIAIRPSQQNIALQNVQARTRMVMSYMCAQLLMQRDRPDELWPGNLLVLGSANLDEGLRGYYTKYDCSSADINPIGSLPKLMIKEFLLWAAEHRRLPALYAIANAKASAELQPTVAGKQAQVSEDEMGMTFDELDKYGRLRGEQRCGPVSMYQKLQEVWTHLSPVTIATKVKTFFKFYAQNRHKTTTLPPAYHLCSHSCDDNRYDLRQILYNALWPRQFRKLDEMSETDERAMMSFDPEESVAAVVARRAGAPHATTSSLRPTMSMSAMKSGAAAGGGGGTPSTSPGGYQTVARPSTTGAMFPGVPVVSVTHSSPSRSSSTGE